MADETKDIRDPFRRQLLQLTQESQAEDGIVPGAGATNESAVAEEAGANEDGTGGAAAAPNVGIRDALLQQAEAGFQRNLTQVRTQAKRRGRVDVGMTSNEELSAARTAQQERLGLLGGFEERERGRRETILSDQAISERANLTTRDIAEQSDKTRREELKESIRSALAGERLTEAQITGFLGQDTDLDPAELGERLGLEVDEAMGPEGPTERLLNAAESLGLNYDPETRRFTGHQIATLEGRRLALDEENSAVQRDIAERTQRLNELTAAHGMAVSEAQVTGIWKEYGGDEMDAFNDAFDSKMGDENYDGRYDFDGNGKIDFKDFVNFAKAADMGGIPTLELQKFREDASQFDISQTNDMTKFNANISEMARQFDLSKGQERDLAFMMLDANTAIAQAQIDVEKIRTIVDMLDSPIALTMDDDDISDMVDYVIDSQAGVDILKTIMGDEYEGASADATNMSSLLMSNEAVGPLIRENGMAWAFDNIDALMEANGEGVGSEALMAAMDLNNDGVIDVADEFYYRTAGGQMTWQSENAEPSPVIPASGGDDASGPPPAGDGNPPPARGDGTNIPTGDNDEETVEPEGPPQAAKSTTPGYAPEKYEGNLAAFERSGLTQGFTASELSRLTSQIREEGSQANEDYKALLTKYKGHTTRVVREMISNYKKAFGR